MSSDIHPVILWLTKMKYFLILIMFKILIFKEVFAIDTTASQAVIYDYETKTVIFEKNSKEYKEYPEPGTGREMLGRESGDDLLGTANSLIPKMEGNLCSPDGKFPKNVTPRWRK